VFKLTEPAQDWCSIFPPRTFRVDSLINQPISHPRIGRKPRRQPPVPGGPRLARLPLEQQPRRDAGFAPVRVYAAVQYVAEIRRSHLACR